MRRLVPTTLLLAALLAGCLSGAAEPAMTGITVRDDGIAQLNASRLAGSGTAAFESPYSLEYGTPVLTQFFANAIYFDQNMIGAVRSGGDIVLNVTRTLRPDNGVPEAVIFPSYNGTASVFVGRAYVDQEFMDAYAGDLRVYWGTGFQHSAAFDPVRIADGIYMDRIQTIPTGDSDSRPQWALGNFSTTPLEPPYDGIGVYTE